MRQIMPLVQIIIMEIPKPVMKKNKSIPELTMKIGRLSVELRQNQKHKNSKIHKTKAHQMK
jgi:hypothetical protein